jgi:hypothetical protein
VRIVFLHRRLEIEGTFQRSAALPDVERQRGTEHGGKAEDTEKAQKVPIRKTCMAW